MNIAEIRKKAHSGKNKDTAAFALTEQKESVVTDTNPRIPDEQQQAKTVFGESSHQSANSLPIDSVSTVSRITENVSTVPVTSVENRDSVEQLFSWSPELEIASNESYGGSVAVEQDKSETDCRQWLAFMLGAEEYSLDIISIREIIKPRDITDIPRVPGFLLGIISLRGSIIPVFDLKRRLHLGMSEIDNNSRIVVCQEGDRFAGLLVDRISQVVSMPEQNIEPPPAILTGIDRELVGGVGRLQGKMMILLHLSSVLNIELV